MTDNIETAPDLAAVMARLEAAEARAEAAEKAAAEAKADAAKVGTTTEPAKKKAPKSTGINTHKANQRGYADGMLIEAGEFVPADVPVSAEWMEPVSKKQAAQDRGIEEALSADDADVDVEALKGDALTAYAASLHINRGEQTDKQLRASVTAKRANTA